MSQFCRVPVWPHRRTSNAGARRSRRKSSGTILLEVVIALALFVAAATIIGSGISRSAEEVAHLREAAHGLDLAVSAMSELQMGLRPLASSEAEPFPAPFDDWSCEVEVEPLTSQFSESEDTVSLLRTQVTVSHDDRVIQRLVKILPAKTSPDNASAASSGSESGPEPNLNFSP